MLPLPGERAGVRVQKEINVYAFAIEPEAENHPYTISIGSRIPVPDK